MRNLEIANTQRTRIKRHFVVVLALVIWMVGGYSVAVAQERQPSRGFQFANSYASNGLDAVNVSNGNVIVNLPIASLPAGRGTSPGFSITLQYNSKLWDSRQATHTDAIQPGGPEQPQPPPPTYWYTTNTLEQSDRGGWKMLTSHRLIETNRLNLEDPNPCTLGHSVEKLRAKWKMEVEFPDGSIRQFIPTYGSSSSYEGYYNVDSNGRQYWVSTQTHPGNGLCYLAYSEGQVTTSGMHYMTTDGSRLRLFIPYHPSQGLWSRNWKIYSPDGTVVEHLPPDDPTVGERITDRNGNKIDNKGNVIVDQLGRSITIDQNGVTVKGVNGESVTTQIIGGSRWVYRQYQITGHDPNETIPNGTDRSGYVNTQIGTIEQVTLPSQLGGQSYVFDYYADINQPSGTNYTDGWGELKSVTLPSNAKATYSYESSGLSGYASEILENKATQRELTYSDWHDGIETPRTETSYYSSFQGSSSFSNPDGTGVSETTFYSIYGTYWDTGLAFKSVQTGGVQTERIWKQNLPYYSGNPYPYPNQQYLVRNANAYVKTEFTSIPNALGQPYLTAIKDFNYDKNGNVTKITEYDWVDYNSVPRQFGKPTGIPSNAAVKRITINEYYNQAPDSESGATSPYTYENPGSPKLLNVIKSTEIQNGNGVPVSRSEFFYDDPNNKGNLIETKVWDSFKGGANQPYSNPLSGSNSISSTVQYDQYGNPVLTTDARGVQTQIVYGDIVGPSGTVSGLYPTQTVAGYGTPLARTSTATYDFFTGLVTSATDVDNGVTSATEYDALGRPLKSIAAVGTPLEVWTRTEYDDVGRRVITRSDLETKGDGKKVAIQHYDQLGRVRLSRSIENIAIEDPYNETHGIKVQTRYSTGNPHSYQLTSNPYRANYPSNETDPTMGWTRSKTINTGKHSEIETFSGGNLPAPWGSNTNSTGVVTTDIDANTTTVIDQAGKKRRTVNNALGHLIRVDEPNDAGQLDVSGSPFQSTNYTYDALNNLLTVIQGSQTRTFVHSSLSRMTSETNPEAGATSYEFDNNGNPTKKTDSRGVATHFVYDALNRVTQKSYTGENGYTTPTITYTYDEVANAKGRLTKISSSISENRYLSFDKMGRVTQSEQFTDGQIYGFEYAYNLAGMLVEQTYPSGRKVKNVFENAGELAMVQSKKTGHHGYWNYAKNFTFTASGAVSSMQLGNGQWQSTQYNPKMQPTQIALGTTQNATNLLKLEFGYGSAQNNGTLLSQTITVPTVGANQGFIATQAYTYDTLNRIKSATETIAGNQTWKQAFLFDRYGNRNFDEINTTTLTKNCIEGGTPAMCVADRKVFNPSVNSANNRLNISEDYVYDNAGNTASDAQGKIFIYDGENKQVEVKNSLNETIGQYFYDGGGKRVKKVVPSNGEITIFVYDSTGKMVAEYSTQLSQTQQVSYTTSDHLGSPRIKTDQNGAVIARNDYHPYGEDLYTEQRTQGLGYKSDDIRQKFTGYERDNETGLDFAQARMYANRLGRFSTTDPSRKSIQPMNPQTWNRYSYCYNNPLALVDDNGKWPTGTHIKIVTRAFDTMSSSRRLTVSEGSRKVDIDGGDVKTMKEGNAPQHAMTPGAWVKEMGIERAQKRAREAAGDFVRDNLSAAANVYRLKDKIGQNSHAVEQDALTRFGAAMHTVMDNRSPAHTGFQVFDGPSATKTIIGAVIGGAIASVPGAIVGAGVGAGGIDTVQHIQTESREPTEDEYNLMVDEMRMAYQKTFGQAAYERDVSEVERRQTAERLSRRNANDMLVR